MADDKQSGGVQTNADGDVNVGGNVVGRDSVQVTTSQVTHQEGGWVARIAVIGIIVVAIVAIATGWLRSSVPTSTPTSAVSAPLIIPSDTIIVASPTASAISTPALQPSATLSAALFSKGCIPAAWRLYDELGLIVPVNNCWPIEDSWGLFPDDNGLLILAQSASAEAAHGIYYPVEGDVTIQFQVGLAQLEVPGEAIGNIAFGIVSTNPVAPLLDGLFFQKERSDFPIVLKKRERGSDAEYLYLDNKLRQYMPGSTHQLTFIIEGPQLTIAFDGEALMGSVKIPSTNRAFWIGYRVPSEGALEVLLSDFTVTSR